MKRDLRQCEIPFLIPKIACLVDFYGNSGIFIIIECQEGKYMENTADRTIMEQKQAKDIIDEINRMLLSGKDIYQVCSAMGISISEYAQLRSLARYK